MGVHCSKLLEPVKIGKVEIKNRVAMAPMGIAGLLNADGSLGPRGIDYYIERARGGVGLIITAVHKVENDIETLAGSARISRASLAPFTELAEAVHALGTKIFVQLTAGFGRVANPRRLPGPPVSASAIPSYWRPSLTCVELTTVQVERLVKCFGDAAEVLVEAGIDGMELHGHEGYLFDQFTTALWNHRTDKYGGTLANRLMLPREVLREIKGRVGERFPVQYRFGLKHYVKALNSGALPGEKFTEAGRDVPEGLEMAKILEESGFDALHVDAGCYDSWYWPHPPTYQEPGAMVEMAAQAKKVVNIPVIGVGKLNDPVLAERVIAEGKVDLVALGKGLLADPFWLQKAAAGQPERIRPCIGCHDACMGRIIRGKPLSCAVNPATGRERAYRIERADPPKKVMIVGSGAAGMEAARVSHLRGHQVTLYEKGQALGGHLIEAAVPAFKKDIAKLLDWYKRELGRLNLRVKTGTEVTPDLVAKEKPEVVVLATGSTPIIPEVPGIDKDKVATAIDLLLGKKKAGQKVLVLGGGLIGCETALWLAQQGKKVTIVEILQDLLMAGIPVQPMNQLMLVDLLRYHQVDAIFNTSLLEVMEDGVLLIDRNFQRKKVPADTVAVAVGLRPDQELHQSLKGEILDLYLIGDGRQAQNLMSSIWDAYEIARWI
jgi:2-enoate reductase